jgi:hypothetical protein
VERADFGARLGNLEIKNRSSEIVKFPDHGDAGSAIPDSRFSIFSFQDFLGCVHSASSRHSGG